MNNKLLPIILKSKSRFKRFLMQNMKTIRNSLTINPLEEYSITSPTTVPVNTLVKQGNYGYVGGDTEYLSYDFGLKVANSVVECPMKVYRMTMNTLLVPSDVNWAEWTDQTSLDRLKIQDSVTVGTSTTTNNYISQIMIELDLTPVANSLYGGSNSALKSALKSISADVWASGFGSSGSVQTYGVIVRDWWESGPSWQDSIGNSTSSISKISYISSSQASAQSRITSANKFYILVASQYTSDGTIASSVSLDYINIGIQLNRTPDVVSPINVSLPKYFAMIGGFSPNFDSNRSGISNKIFSLIIDSNNRFILSRNQSSQLFFAKVKSGTTLSLVASTTGTFSKNQIIRYIVGQNANGMFMYLLKNNGTVEKVTNTDTNILSGSMPLQILNQSNIEQGDMFAESFTLLDLNKLGRTNGFSDSEADAILRGTAPNLIGLYNTELFDITKVVLDSHASLSNNTITLNATANFQNSVITIPVLPNNQYALTFTKTANAYVHVFEYYNNIVVKQSTYVSSSYIFTTKSNTNNIIIKFGNDVIGTFTFSNISIKIKM